MPPEEITTDDARFRLASERAVARVIDGDAIVIDTITGRYYSLEGPSQTAWTLLTASASVTEVAVALRERFETGDADAAGDVRRLAAELLAENLIVSSEEGAPPESYSGEREPYVALTLTVFHDMEELLAFDPPLPVTDVSVWTADEGA